jgi:hypothetical protein
VTDVTCPRHKRGHTEPHAKCRYCLELEEAFQDGARDAVKAERARLRKVAYQTGAYYWVERKELEP